MRDVKEVFIVSKRYKMKLNPAKCVFSIKAGKFLEFIVSKTGIEPNPKKLKALTEMSLLELSRRCKC